MFMRVNECMVLSCCVCLPVCPLPSVDHNDQELLAEVLTDANFDTFVNGNEVVLVNFYAPWCHWSRLLV